MWTVCVDGVCEGMCVYACGVGVYGAGGVCGDGGICGNGGICGDGVGVWMVCGTVGAGGVGMWRLSMGTASKKPE